MARLAEPLGDDFRHRWPRGETFAYPSLAMSRRAAHPTAFAGTAVLCGLMPKKKVLDQHIAVFGESGSGKTVLVSSFYGATQEPTYKEHGLYDIVADDIGLGGRLHKNYLGMRDAARVPNTTTFNATSYAFSLKMRASDPGAAKARSFEALRLVWHDYPGEWFEEEPSGPEEARRRVSAFRALLSSDVAVILVDGQMLLDNVGHEERYLRALLSNFSNGLRRLKDDLLEDSSRLVRFPRIWVLAVSKADLLPHMDVFAFRDLMIGTVAEDIGELRRVLAEFVEGDEALAVGEDFVMLSAARFGDQTIEVSKRIGVDLMLPLAAVLPFERHARWVRAGNLSTKVAEHLVRGVGVLAPVLAMASRLKLPRPFGFISKALAALLTEEAINQMTELTEVKLKEMIKTAEERKDFLAASLGRFHLDLADAEKKKVLLRSLR